MRLKEVAKIDDKTGKPRMRDGKGEHKGKKFRVTYPIVTTVLELPDEVEATPVKGKRKASKTTKTVAKKATKKADTEDNTDAVDLFLTDLLVDAKNNIIQKSSLALAVTRKAQKNGMKEGRDDLRKTICDENYLVDAAERGVITFDVSSKKQEVGLPE